LAALALAGFFVPFRAGAAPAPKADQPRKDDVPRQESAKEPAPKPAEPGRASPDEFEGALQEMLRRGMPAEHAQAMLRQMRQSMDMARQMTRGMPGRFPFFGPPAEGRLGVVASKPGATLVEQLDLPEGQGLVVEEVQPDSAAARAGVKPHDILLELNGKPVPDSVPELAKQLDDIQAEKPVEAVVLRKGKRETIKGLSLPEAKAAGPAFPGLGMTPLAVPVMPPAGAFHAMPAGPLPFAGANGVLMTTFRTGDRFTTRHQEGSLILTVTGTVADGKAKVREIQVQDGAVSHTYASADKVPEAYRDKVKNLLEMSEKSATRVEIKTP
jgi:membrane-associated protease RseP (regulator of RpoE activity)